MNRPVYIADCGLLCARGNSGKAVANALWDGEHASSTCQVGKRSFPYFSFRLMHPTWLTRAEQAVRQVAGQLGPLASDTPLFIASSSFQIGLFEEQGAVFEMPLPSASFSRQIAEWLAFSGLCSSVSNACISGFSAIDAARNLIAAGQIDEAVVFGFELANRSTLAGFAAMELLSGNVCRPFDARRDGLVLGEAVAAIRLTAHPTRWRIAGLGTGLDAWSATGPDPSGGPIARVTVDALNEANFKATDIELIKLQAAGSPSTDLAEANALHKVFGQHMPPLLSLKPALGHTLGASGIAELATLIACLNDDRIPATAGFARADPEIALFPLVDRSNLHIERALLNLVGFGGGLATLIIERQP